MANASDCGAEDSRYNYWQDMQFTTFKYGKKTDAGGECGAKDNASEYE